MLVYPTGINVFVLARLRNGHQFAVGFRVGTATVYQYVTEAAELLAALRSTDRGPRPARISTDVAAKVKNRRVTKPATDCPLAVCGHNDPVG
jgi:hypothetical protein